MIADDDDDDDDDDVNFVLLENAILSSSSYLSLFIEYVVQIYFRE